MTHSRPNAQTGKPSLTEKNINRLIPIDSRSAKFRDLAREAQLDFKGFLTKHFSLTQRQVKSLNALAKENLDRIRVAINEVQQTGTPLRVKLAGSGVPVEKPSVEVVREVVPAESLEEETEIHSLHQTATANARPVEFVIIKIQC